MKFRATPDQIVEMFRLAINASTPMGLGVLHFVSGDMSADEIRDSVLAQLANGRVNADYVQGRMVKLSIRQTVADIRKDQCVECLEKALEHAKAGEYSSVTVMAESVDDDSMYWSYTPCKETFVELLGKLDVLKWKIYQRMSDSTEAIP